MSNKRNYLISAFFTSSFLFIIFIFFLFLLKNYPLNQVESIKNQQFIFNNFNNNNNNIESAFAERAFLYDTEPIFIPTQWTESHSSIENLIDNPLFEDFPPALVELEYQKFFNIDLEFNLDDPTLLLNSQTINPFSGIDRNNLNVNSLQKRTAYINIKNLNTQVTQSYALQETAPHFIKEQLWSPLEFLFLVDDSGPILPPLMVASSGVEQIDHFFKSYISNPPLNVSHLGPGYYRVLISP